MSAMKVRLCKISKSAPITDNEAKLRAQLLTKTAECSNLRKEVNKLESEIADLTNLVGELKLKQHAAYEAFVVCRGHIDKLLEDFFVYLDLTE